MTRPECPTHGVIAGLGRCYVNGCTFDARDAESEGNSAVEEVLPDTRSEVEIRMAIRTALELHGYVVVDFEQGYRPDGSTRVRKGVADLYAMGRGRSAWIEVKSAKGRQTDEQKAFQADCEACGVDYYVWRSESEAIAWAAGVSREGVA